MPIVLKSGSLNFLESSGPVQACNGNDLPLPLPFPLLFSICNQLHTYQSILCNNNIRHGSGRGCSVLFCMTTILGMGVGVCSVLFCITTILGMGVGVQCVILYNNNIRHGSGGCSVLFCITTILGMGVEGAVCYFV